MMDIDPSRLDGQGCNLLHAMWDGWLGDVKDLAIFKKLLDLGCDIRQRDHLGQSVLHHIVSRCAIRNGEWPGLERVIAEVARVAPDLLNAVNSFKSTPLHYSILQLTMTVPFRQKVGMANAWPEYLDLPHCLLRLGANASGVTKDGNSVLHLIAPGVYNQDIGSLFSELVNQRGADINARNAKGQTPLLVFANRYWVLTEVFPRLFGRWKRPDGLVEAVARLKALGADFSARDLEGNGVLHLAAADAAVLFKTLMDESGLDPMMENAAHQTAIDLAATYNNSDVLALFEKKK